MKPVKTALIVSGGGAPHPKVLDEVGPWDFAVAADSGLDEAHALGLAVDLAVGDFDSASATAIARACEAGTRLERHPREKDSTDLEIAIVAARELGAGRIVIVGPSGGRFDHLIAGTLLLGAERHAGLAIQAWLGEAWVGVIHGGGAAPSVSFGGVVGEYVTLLAINGVAHGVSTTGLRYGLQRAALIPGSSLGVSNELSAPHASVEVETGTVMVIRPHALGGNT